MNIERAINIEDVRKMAKSYLPKIAFDFIDGGVEDELGLAHNRAAYRKYHLLPRYLVDVSKVDQSVVLFGRTYSRPIGISPMGIAGFFRPGADLMLARAAAEANIPYLMSSASCDSIEAASKAGPTTTWFQIYGARDTNITQDLVKRARNLNVPVLVMTVDTPALPTRERNVRNGYSRPVRLTPSIVLQGMFHPRWSLGYLRNGGVPMMQNWKVYAAPGANAGAVADLYSAQTPAPAQTWKVLEEVRKLWPGPLVVKGILTPEDAKRCVEIGVQGLLVSNHGARQLDRAPSPLEMLPLIKEVVPEGFELIVDGGVRRGADALVALCLGAKAAFFGRPAMFGVAAAGPKGAEKVLGIFQKEMDALMRQMGCPTVADLDKSRLYPPSH